jgi:hypothetical protein
VEKVLLVGAGGFVGSVLRYLVGGLVQSLVPASTFPYGTMAVNSREKIDDNVTEGLATMEKVDVRLYRSGQPGTDRQ